MKVYSENNVQINMNSDYLTPKKAEVYFNKKMHLNRELVYSILRCSYNTDNGVFQCLDAFSATGICSLQWKKNLKNNVNVYASDTKSECIKYIKDNCELNNLHSNECNLDVKKEEIDSRLNLYDGVNIFHANANVVMLVKSFDFIHLDPFGSTSPFMENAFRQLRGNGVLVLTSTDVASLLTRNPQTIMRNYGVRVVKTEYNRELAVRTVIAAAARAAAKSNRGIKVLLSVVDPLFILVAIKVIRGASHADADLTKVTDLLHCRVCEERAWFPTGDRLAPLEQPTATLLSCSCQAAGVGTTSVRLGPFWSGDIFDQEFVRSMMSEKSDFLQRSKPFRKLMTAVAQEITTSLPGNDSDLTKQFPSFYYFLCNLNVGPIWPRLDHVIEALCRHGYWATRSHFDVNAVRTSASRSQLFKVVSSLLTAEGCSARIDK